MFVYIQDKRPTSRIKAETYKTLPSVGLHRYLQGTTVVLNALINVFVPNLADQVENQIATTMDPVNVNYKVSDDQGQVQLTFNSTFCNETMANSIINYTLGTMTGLSTVEVTRLELVAGSEDINLPFLSFFGQQEATWSGEWILEATFQKLDAATTAVLSNTFCGFTFTEDLTGTSTVTSPNLAARIFLAGETSNIYQFNSNTQLNQASIRDLTFGYSTFDPSLGTFQDMVTLDADAPMIELGQAGLAGELRDQIQTEIQKGIDSNMPYKL